jgi:hypothetical protein
MLRDSRGVFALLASLGAVGPAACTTNHVDFFDPSWPETPAKDAASNPSPDSAAVDAPGQVAESGPLADTGQGPAEHDAGSRDSALPPPTDDARPIDPPDAPGPEDAGGMEIPDGRGVDVRFDINLPGFDAGWPFDSGPIGNDCTSVHGIVFRGHCYFVIPPTAWDENACTSRGAHLATITSADEQTAVAALAPGQGRWVGLRRQNGSPRAPDSFDWVTGEPLSYANWAVYNDNSREPNGTGDCVRLLDDGTWADSACSDRNQALCERE